MMNRSMFRIAAAAVAIAAFSAPAAAQYESDPYGKDEAGYGYPGKDDGYDSPPPPPPAPAYEEEGEEYRGQTWRGEDGRVHCRRSDGTTGLIVGAGAGALVGRGIDTRGERATGTIIGGIAGALAGRAVERSATRCR
ncbi:MAG TPA: glycine zipper 2TM domain-containing protein [Allosphingosinicella sp.]|nr:glycine zipper 2TM domain-containing protein [Allosphingosinicella sp.]